MAQFTGQLRSNEIFGALFNMIISQEVFASNINGTYGDIADRARVDGSLYGDTKIYYATDALKSHPWGADEEATNLLALHRPDSPKQQEIILDTFRQIDLTIDEYLSKRAWGSEGAFSSFTSVILGWVRETKRVYDSTTYNAFLGTCVATRPSQNRTISIVAGKEAESVAEGIANLMTEMEDVSRDFNDYGFLRSYKKSDIKVIWNAQYLNKIKKFDMPVIFHNEGMIDKLEDALPKRYFGTINSGTQQGDGKKVCSLIEQEINGHHYFAGELILSSDTAPEGTSYTIDDTIICKVVTKLPPFMSAFEVGTSFYNPKSLTTNHYLTWGHNTLVALESHPMITIKTTAAVPVGAKASK